jgi:hypothetical protein
MEIEEGRAKEEGESGTNFFTTQACLPLMCGPFVKWDK